jgi:hypothetical protein
MCLWCVIDGFQVSQHPLYEYIKVVEIAVAWCLMNKEDECKSNTLAFMKNKLNPKTGYSSSPSWCLQALVGFVHFWKLSLWCSLHWLEKQKSQWKWPKQKLSCSIIYFGCGTNSNAHTFELWLSYFLFILFLQNFNSSCYKLH